MHLIGMHLIGMHLTGIDAYRSLASCMDMLGHVGTR